MRYNKSKNILYIIIWHPIVFNGSSSHMFCNRPYRIVQVCFFHPSMYIKGPIEFNENTWKNILPTPSLYSWPRQIWKTERFSYTTLYAEHITWENAWWKHSLKKRMRTKSKPWWFFFFLVRQNFHFKKIDYAVINIKVMHMNMNKKV